MQMPELAFFVITLPFSIWAAWGDLKRMKITNRFNLILFGVFLVSGLLLLPLGDYALRIGVAAAALAVGFLLNMARVMGGGDAKYIAALIPFIDPADLTRFFIVLAVCLLAAVVTHRAARAIPAIRRATPDWVSWTAGSRFPMGFGLSGGLSMYLALTGFGLSAVAG